MHACMNVTVFLYDIGVKRSVCVTHLQNICTLRFIFIPLSIQKSIQLNTLPKNCFSASTRIMHNNTLIFRTHIN